MMWILTAVLLASPVSPPQDSRIPNPFAAHPKVDQPAIDQAVRRGIEYLKSQSDHHRTRFEDHARMYQHAELVLLTYIHGGMQAGDPSFKPLFDDMMGRKLDTTYGVSLQAMVLEELDRVKYQERIRQCAQFLVDNQRATGAWSYGDVTPHAIDVPTSAPIRKDTPTGAGDTGRGKPKPLRKIPIKKMRDAGEMRGDNSNSQYAALGMRACHDAGIILPPEVVERAIQWWRGSQKAEKGVRADRLELDGMAAPNSKRSTTALQVAVVEPQGWCYHRDTEDHSDHGAYGSMTAGAVASLAILDYIKDKDEGKKRSWKGDRDIHEGLQWLAKNFSVTCNPGTYEHTGQANSREGYFYYLYALERAGMLYGSERLGAHEWYPTGAKALQESQNADGSWGAGTVDTCFAILFLRRATRPIDVASVDRFHTEK